MLYALFILALAPILPLAAWAAPPDADRDSKARIAAAMPEFLQTFDVVGLDGLAQMVDACYAETHGERTLTPAVERCIAYDFALTAMEETYQRYVLKQFGVDEPVPPFSRTEAWQGRVFARLRQVGLTGDAADERAKAISDIAVSELFGTMVKMSR